MIIPPKGVNFEIPSQAQLHWLVEGMDNVLHDISPFTAQSRVKESCHYTGWVVRTKRVYQAPNNNWTDMCGWRLTPKGVHALPYGIVVHKRPELGTKIKQQ